MIFFSLGIIRALIGGVVGAGLGMGITAAIRIASGMPAWSGAPVTVVGIFVGLLGFLIGVGALNSWSSWVAARDSRGGPHPGPLPKGEGEQAGTKGEGEQAGPTGGGATAHPMPAWTRYFGFDTNHKVIGIQYMVTSLVFMFFAGPLGILDRIELTATGPTIMDPATYNTVISVHGITMIVVILIGISGMMNYLLPLMIGARDMAFPRLNALSYWIVPPAGVLLILSLFFGGFDTGWTAYPPLSARAPLGMQFMLLGVYIAGFSSILGGINFVTTIFKMRAPGMGFFRMPVFAWATLATAFLQITFTQFIGMSFLMVELERLLGLAFFVPEKGGNVILYQHLFWFYSHPAVYIFVLPGLGVIGEIVPVFSRKPLFGYKMVAVSSPAIALGGAWVWGHHMFAAGMEEFLRAPFMFTTLLVAVPTGVKIFSWLATMWMGRLHLATPFLFVLTSIVVFLIGGLTGIVQGIVPTDLHVTDTYWIVAHFHHTLFGGFVFPMMAAIYYWFPKMTGRLLHEGLGKTHWAMMSLGFFLLYIPMFYVGINGMRRRISDFDPTRGYEPWNIVSAAGSIMIALSLLVFIANVLITARRGAPAPANPWRSRTLEWQVSSPPPEENFAALPRVVDNPYGYGVPGSVHAIMPEGGEAGTPHHAG